MLTVCLPSQGALRLSSPLPDGVEAVVWNGSAPTPNDAERTEFLVVLQNSPFTALFDAMPRLQVVQTVSAGIDYLTGLVPQGVTLCDGRGIHGGAVAEWVMTAILSSLREFPGFLRAQEHREWTQHVTGELSGKRVLIVGAGDLGDHTARRVAAFEAEPVLVARHARDGVFGTDRLPELLPTADVVVLVVPETDETHHMVDQEFLACMRDGALLVNAARGPVVVTEALLAELEARRLHAALDVTDPEPLPSDHPLWRAPNLLITPHVGGAVQGFPARAYKLVHDQIERYVKGEPLVNVVHGAY